MSVQVMGWVWANSAATGIDKLVLLAVADSANDDGGNAWPSIALLSRKAGVNERTVQRAIRRLVESGALRVKANAGRHGVNVYRVVMKPPAQSHPDNLSPRRSATVTKPPRQNAAPAESPNTPGTVPPEPSLNRPKSRTANAVLPQRTITQRSKAITDAYAEAEPMCKWPAVNAVVIRALKAEKWADDEVRDAVLRLAKEGRGVTVETLRVELNGLPPPRQRPAAGNPYLDDLRADYGNVRALEAKR